MTGFTHDPNATHDRLAVLLRNVTIVFGVTVLVAIAAVSYAFATRTSVAPVYDPLGDWPTQSISSAQPIPVGQDIGVDATKCNNLTTTERHHGVTTWQLVAPPGSSFPAGEGVGSLAPGCHSFHFQNPMPAAVIDRVKALALQGVHKTTWFVTGTVTPIDPHGGRPIQKVWRTLPFVVVG